jgi:phospholipid/cholesterol/gamma-HCH transport system ATP-binding protein
MIAVVNIRKTINGQEILKGVNLEIPTGETTAIIGRSGGGKTILLRHLVGLIKPDSGSIYVNDKDITKLNGKDLNSIKSRFGMLFQNAALFDSLTVFDNVAFPLRELTDLKDDEIRELTLKALMEVGLKGMEHKYADEISGGMKKRVALARVLIRNPEFIFFDEPTSGLDPITENAIQQLIKKCSSMIECIGSECSKVKCTELIVSHNIKEVLKLSDRVAMLHDGVIIEATTPEKLMNSSNPVVRQFLSGSLEGPLGIY